MSERTIDRRRLERVTGERATETTALSVRERQVLYLVAQGFTNAAAGKVLYLAEDTVKTHLRRAFGKLGAFDRAHAVTEGFHRKILSSVGGRLAVDLPAGDIPVVKL